MTSANLLSMKHPRIRKETRTMSKTMRMAMTKMKRRRKRLENVYGVSAILFRVLITDRKEGYTVGNYPCQGLFSVAAQEI